MPQLRIMTWNIRNLGPTKLEYDDIMAAIAKVVVREQPDIFVALEINTKKEATAEAIGAILQAELQQAEAARQNNNNNNNNNNNAFPMGRKAWDTYGISPNTGLEFYGFFIRDTRVVQPVPMTSAIANNVLNDLAGSGVGAQTFTTWGGPGHCVFPLIRPNLTRQGQRKRAKWTGARIPGLGVFNVAGAQQPYLPILAGHFAANSAQAERQINVLPAFDLVNEICSPNANANPTARPTVDGQANHQFRHLIVTGDFNVDFDPFYYQNGVALKNQERWGSKRGSASDTESDDDSDPEWTPSGRRSDNNNNNNNNNDAKPKKRKFPYGALLNTAKSTVSLGLKAAVVHKTHLMKPKQVDRDVKSTEDLATSCYDNFFVSGSITVVSAGAVDVPAQFKQSDDRLQLDVSVENYATRGMKDLYWDDYEVPSKDVATQLMTGTSESMSTTAALTGALLISDHLPVVMDFTIP